MRWIIITIVCIFLSGCVDNEPRFEAPGHNNFLTKDDIGEVVDQSLVKRDGDIGELRSEIVKSSNTTQNAIQGVGVSVSKVAEKVQLVGGDVKGIEANVKAELRVQNKIQLDRFADINATFKNELHANLDARFTANNTAQLNALNNLRVELTSKIDAIAQAQVGMNNSIENHTKAIQTTTAAGRDNFTTHTEFSKEMLEQSKSDNRTIFWTVAVCSIASFSVLLIVAVTIIYFVYRLLEDSRRRAEKRAEFVNYGRLESE